MRVRNTEHEFPNGDTRKQPGLSEKSIVCGSLQLEEDIQIVAIFRKARQNALVAVDISRGNEAMSIIASNLGNARRHLTPAAARVEKLSHAEHSGLAAFHHVNKWGFTFEHRIVVRQLHPMVGELLAVQNV